MKNRALHEFMADEEKFYELSEYGLAERLIDAHGQDLHYCFDWGEWLIWDGRIWRIDQTGEVIRRAKQVVRALRNEAILVDDKALKKHARESESRGKLIAMIGLAESEKPMPILTSDLDQESFHFVCKNGVIDLASGKLLKHHRELLVSKMSPIKYAEDAQCPRWLEFLFEIFDGNSELMAVVQRAVGYSLTASTEEQCLFLLHGAGANGKSTFLSVLQHILGDYSKTAAPNLLAAKRGDPHPTGLADLFNARMVVSHEWGAGRAFDEELVKQLTGGDRIRARRMRENFFEFSPTHKLWIAANHLPRIRQADYGIWRRVVLFPFTVTIPPEKRQNNLVELLLREAPGILAWAVDGCQSWRAAGLGTTKIMADAKDKYREEMDALGPFLDLCCVIGDDHCVDAKTLYLSYQHWAKDVGEQVQSANWLGRQLTQRGFTKRRRSGGWSQWLGISVVNPSDPRFQMNNSDENDGSALKMPF